jgi:hypothetical protein
VNRLKACARQGLGRLRLLHRICSPRTLQSYSEAIWNHGINFELRNKSGVVEFMEG